MVARDMKIFDVPPQRVAEIFGSTFGFEGGRIDYRGA